VFKTLCSSVSFVFFYMLQQFYLNVSKVDRVLHIGCAWKAANSMGDVRGGMGDVWGWRGPAAATLALEPNTLGCSLACCAAPSGR
jgi:hypothetical protein